MPAPASRASDCTMRHALRPCDAGCNLQRAACLLKACAVQWAMQVLHTHTVSMLSGSAVMPQQWLRVRSYAPGHDGESRGPRFRHFPGQYVIHSASDWPACRWHCQYLGPIWLPIIEKCAHYLSLPFMVPPHSMVKRSVGVWCFAARMGEQQLNCCCAVPLRATLGKRFQCERQPPMLGMAG